MIKNPLLDKDFLKKIDLCNHKTIYAKIILLTFDEEPVEEIQGKITQGSINIDGASAVRRTCSLTMTAQDININNNYWALKNKFKLEVGIENYVDSSYPKIIWFKQGIFLFTSLNMNVQSNNFTISIQGKDKMALLNGEIGGNIMVKTDFGQIEEYTTLDDGEITRSLTKIPIKNIIKNIVNVYGKEPKYNIILNDIDNYGLELLEYRGDKTLYKGKDKNGEIANIYTKKPDNQEFEKIETYDVIGYRKTDLTFPGELVANVGETVVSVLDKIKNTFSDFEYFYDLDGRFVFQKKQTYINESWNTIQTDGESIYADSAANNSMDVYSFQDGMLLTAFSNTPTILNIKNDFSIWGSKQSASGEELPIHIRYAIDNKPLCYKNADGIVFCTSEYKTPPENEEVRIECDWREIIYQMAKDYYKYGIDNSSEYESVVAKNNPSLYPSGETGYEQYYSDVFGFWREIYNPVTITKDGHVELISDKELDQLIRNYILESRDFNFYEGKDKNPIIDSNIENPTSYLDWINLIKDRIKKGFPAYSPAIMAIFELWFDYIENEQKTSIKEYFSDIDFQELIEEEEKEEKDLQDENYLKALQIIRKIKIIFLGWEDYRVSEIASHLDKWLTVQLNNIVKNENKTEEEKEKEREELLKEYDKRLKNFDWIFDTGIEQLNINYNKIIDEYLKNGGLENDWFVTVLKEKRKQVNSGIFNTSKVTVYSKYIIDEVLKKYDISWNSDFMRTNYQEEISKVEGKDKRSEELQILYLSRQLKILLNDWWESDISGIILEGLGKDKNIPDEEKDKISAYQKIKNAVIETQDWKSYSWKKRFELLERVLNQNKNDFKEEAKFSLMMESITIIKDLIENNLLFDYDRFIYYRVENYANGYQTTERLKAIKEKDAMKDYKILPIAHEYDPNIRAFTANSITEGMVNIYKKYYGAVKTDLNTTGNINVIYAAGFKNFKTGEKGWRSDIYNSEIKGDMTLDDVKSPENLVFWLEFLSPKGDLRQYSVQAIGCRTKTINDSNIKSISYKEIPSILLISEEDRESLSPQDYLDLSGYTFINYPEHLENYFSISAQGKSALNELDNLLYQFTYMTQSVTLTSLPLYHLQPNNIISISDKNTNIYGKYIINKISIPLQYNGTSSISATKVIDRLY